MSHETVCDSVRPAGAIRDGCPSGWHPAELSERELRELQRRLVKVQTLGDAFAKVDFSPQALHRLHMMKGGAGD